MLKRHVRVIFSDLYYSLPPEARDFEHVRFINRSDFTPPLARQLEGDARDALNFRCAVAHRVERGLAVRATRLAEVKTAEQLADNQHICALNYTGLERRGVRERREQACGPQVGVSAERVANLQQS